MVSLAHLDGDNGGLKEERNDEDRGRRETRRGMSDSNPGKAFIGPHLLNYIILFNLYGIRGCYIHLWDQKLLLVLLTSTVLLPGSVYHR